MDCREFLSRWRSWIRPLVISVYVVTLLIALPLLVVELNLRGTKTHTQAWLVGGIFVILAIPISMWGILNHMIHYTQPHLQRHIIRVLWMVPIYAMDAWLALRFKEAAIYLDTLRECYEAYVVYNFMAYLLSFLTSQYADLDGEIASRPQVKHIVPFCCLPAWPMGRTLIQYCKHGVLQYTVVRPLTTCISLICQKCNVYHEGDFSYKSAWTYLALINNISQVWAMYCLVLFYMATKDQLAPIKPVAKFMCIKAVVFLTFWQSVLIAFLVKMKVIRADNTSSLDFSTEDIATGLQDFIICVEMFFAAIAHYFSFSHKPFMESDGRLADCCTSFAAMWDVSDVRADVVDHVRHVSKTVSRTLRRGPSAAGNERTPLLGDAAAAAASTAHLDQNSHTSLGNSLGNVLDFQSSQGSYLGARRGSIGTINSLDASMTDTLSRRSLTASMNNYMDLSESIDDRDVTIHDVTHPDVMTDDVTHPDVMTDDVTHPDVFSNEPMSRSLPENGREEETGLKLSHSDHGLKLSHSDHGLKLSHPDHGRSKRKESRTAPTLIVFDDDDPPPRAPGGEHGGNTNHKDNSHDTGEGEGAMATRGSEEGEGATRGSEAGEGATRGSEVGEGAAATKQTVRGREEGEGATRGREEGEGATRGREEGVRITDPFKAGDGIYEEKEVENELC